MTLHGGEREVRNLAVGNFGLDLHLAREATKAGAEDDRGLRCQGGALADGGDRRLDLVVE